MAGFKHRTCRMRTEHWVGVSVCTLLASECLRMTVLTESNLSRATKHLFMREAFNINSVFCKKNHVKMKSENFSVLNNVGSGTCFPQIVLENQNSLDFVEKKIFFLSEGAYILKRCQITIYLFLISSQDSDGI